MLMTAYTRRKRFEAKLMALEIWSLLGEAMSKGKKGAQAQPVSASYLFNKIGKQV